MLLVIVGKGHQNQQQHGNQGEHHNAQHRQGQQSDVELLVQVFPQVLHKGVDMLASLGLHLQLVGVHHIAHTHNGCYKPDHEAEQGEQQNHEGIVIVVPFRLHGLHVKDLLCLNGAQGAELRHIGHGKIEGKYNDRDFQQRHQDGFHILLSAEITSAPPE